MPEFTNSASTTVTMLGLGSMGSALTRAFLAAGYRTTVWNRTAAKAEPFAASGAHVAAAVDEAVGGMLLSTLLGFYQGAASLQARERTAASMVRYAEKWLDMIKAILPDAADRIDRRDYREASSSIDLFLSLEEAEQDLARETGVDAGSRLGAAASRGQAGIRRPGPRRGHRGATSQTCHRPGRGMSESGRATRRALAFHRDCGAPTGCARVRGTKENDDGPRPTRPRADHRRR